MTVPLEKTKNNSEKSVAHILTVTGKATTPQVAGKGSRKKAKNDSKIRVQ